ncbi:hypothetical protein BJX61DRAFT_10539 [Aspergillus egyptiacus]|nr:hypothetical protein BJX61DRAFT_10539 [Aspergillus egyptiacus]
MTLTSGKIPVLPHIRISAPWLSLQMSSRAEAVDTPASRRSNSKQWLCRCFNIRRLFNDLRTKDQLNTLYVRWAILCLQGDRRASRVLAVDDRLVASLHVVFY